MATTVSVTRAAEFAYAGTGDFGRRVARLLAELDGGDGTHAEEEIEAALSADARAVVVAVWRPDPGLCELADAAAYLAGRPWLPIVMEHPVIYVGPLIRPPQGPCFSCLWRRRIQHDVHHAATAAVHAAYANDNERGPAGYLPAHARLAAGVAHRMLRQPEGSAAGGISGDACVLTLPGSRIMTRQVIRCGDCPRCSGAEPAAAHPWRAR